MGNSNDSFKKQLVGGFNPFEKIVVKLDHLRS